MRQQNLNLVVATLLVVLMALIGCNQTSMAKLEANKDVVRRFNEAFNNQDLDLWDELIVPNFVRHSQATPDLQITSLEQFKQLNEQFFESFPDIHSSIELMVAEGELVAVYTTFTGTQEGPMGAFPASGKKAESKTLAIFRLEGRKIAELWIEWDNVAFLTQLGHFPPSVPEHAGE